MDHASISRYHAVLQFVDDGTVAQLVDLGSSHGSFINKQKVQPSNPLRLNIGDQIRFGMSSRIWIFGSSDQDILGSHDGQEKPDSVQKIKQSSKKSPYGRDPVKVLRLLLEENEHSYEPKFATQDGLDSTDTSAGEESTERVYFVQISLPFSDRNGSPLDGIAKAGRRQDAERLACLDALEKLDKHGYMDSSDSKALADDPYGRSHIDDGYDDQDDAYYDHTLQHSKRSAGTQVPCDVPETFASLSAKLVQVNADIAQMEQNTKSLFSESAKVPANNDDDEDELDAYMNTLARSEREGDQKKLDEQLDALRKQKNRLETLVKLVAPDDDTGQPSASPQMRKAGDDNGSAKEPSNLPIQPSVYLLKRRRVQGPTRQDPENNITSNPGRPNISATKPEAEKEEESWQPPSDQTGDGRTSLNEKYGY
ncbi:hypothetical protein EV178_001739 [Coemansia sp. RSA 1646]|nr:hypothetical protein EV178_001739 [Coemansia sp. RSA 1646]